MAKVSIMATQIVKPIGAAPQEGGYYLSAWDQGRYGIYNQTVHLYNPPGSDMFEALRESLGQALAHFYPLAGRLQWAHGRLEVNCNARGASLVEAECDEDLAYFNADLAPEKVEMLVPAVDVDSTPLEELPLLHVQFTRLRCGGAALGIAACLVLVDGLSAFHFFGEWARLTRGEPLKEAPFLDRKAMLLSVREGSHRRRQLSFSDHTEFSPSPLLIGNKSGSDEQNKEIIKLKLSLTEAQIHALKAAAEPRATQDGDSRPYTRYEVVTAHMWRCACKARGHSNEQPTAIYTGISARSRFHSILFPPRYFGNAIFRMNTISKAGEIISNPLGFACSKIREAITRVDEDYIRSHIELLEEKQDLSFFGLNKRVKSSGIISGNPNLRVTSWLTLPMYDLNFGWGSPVSVSPILHDTDGFSYLVPKPNDRSIEVFLCLQVDHVDDFKKYFYEDI